MQVCFDAKTNWTGVCLWAIRMITRCIDITSGGVLEFVDCLISANCHCRGDLLVKLYRLNTIMISAIDRILVWFVH